MTKNKILILGAGRIFSKHFEYLTSKSNKFFKVVAIVEKQKKSLLKIDKKYDTIKFNNLQTAINNVDFDTALILTESGTHAKYAKIFIKLNKNVIIEKPIAVSLKDAENLVKLENKYKKKIFIVKQNRFNRPIQQLKKSIIKNKIGNIFIATTRVRWMRDHKYYSQAKWRGSFKNDGGVICNQAIHHIDLLQWLVGDVYSVFAYKKKVFAKIECEDTAVAILKFKNGALGTFEATTATRPKNIEGSISILGKKGTIEVAGFSANKIKIWETNNKIKFKKEKFNENPPNIYGFGHIKFYEFVRDCLINKTINSLNAKEGIKSLRIVSAMYKSFQTGREVKLTENLNNTKLGK